MKKVILFLIQGILTAFVYANDECPEHPVKYKPQLNLVNSHYADYIPDIEKLDFSSSEESFYDKTRATQKTGFEKLIQIIITNEDVEKFDDAFSNLRQDLSENTCWESAWGCQDIFHLALINRRLKIATYLADEKQYSYNQKVNYTYAIENFIPEDEFELEFIEKMKKNSSIYHQKYTKKTEKYPEGFATERNYSCYSLEKKTLLSKVEIDAFLKSIKNKPDLSMTLSNKSRLYVEYYRNFFYEEVTRNLNNSPTASNTKEIDLAIYRNANDEEIIKLISFGETPSIESLLYSIMIKDDELFRIILTSKIDIHQKDNFGRNALYYAAMMNNMKIFETLISYGLNYYEDSYGLNPIEILFLNENKEYKYFEENFSIGDDVRNVK